MKKRTKRMVALFMMVMMLVGSSLSVHALSGTYEYGNGTYTYNVSYSSPYAIVSGSYSTESPSDSYVYCSALGYYYDSSSHRISVGGTAGFFKRYNSPNAYRIQCTFYIEGTVAGERDLRIF